MGKFRIVVVALALLSGACSGGGTHVATIGPRPTIAPSTTTSTDAPAPAAVAAAAAPAPHQQRVRALPGEPTPPRAPSAPRGPRATGRIIIPSIGLDHQTYEGIDLATIDYGPSHWPGTALPGETGNATFPGHRVTHSHPFFNIDLIKTGDQVIFVNDSGRYTYEATDEFVVDADAVWIADPTDTPTFTIFGCHPKHQATQRYVVKGKLVKTERTAPTPPASSGGAGGSDGGQPSGTPPKQPPTTTTTCLLCLG